MALLVQGGMAVSSASIEKARRSGSFEVFHIWLSEGAVVPDMRSANREPKSPQRQPQCEVMLQFAYPRPGLHHRLHFVQRRERVRIRHAREGSRLRQIDLAAAPVIVCQSIRQLSSRPGADAFVPAPRFAYPSGSKSPSGSSGESSGMTKPYVETSVENGRLYGQ